MAERIAAAAQRNKSQLISKNLLCGSVYLMAQINACIQAQLTAAIITYHFKLALYHNLGMSALDNRHKYA